MQSMSLSFMHDLTIQGLFQDCLLLLFRVNFFVARVQDKCRLTQVVRLFVYDPGWWGAPILYYTFKSQSARQTLGEILWLIEATFKCVYVFIDFGFRFLNLLILYDCRWSLMLQMLIRIDHYCFIHWKTPEVLYHWVFGIYSVLNVSSIHLMILAS